MRRRMEGPNSAVYRAVIVRVETIPKPNTFVTYAGPFLTEGAAKAAITNAQGRMEHRQRFGSYAGITITGCVEKSTGWEKVGNQ